MYINLLLSELAAKYEAGDRQEQPGRCVLVKPHDMYKANLSGWKGFEIGAGCTSAVCVSTSLRCDKRS
jgi:hypothetical protein